MPLHKDNCKHWFENIIKLPVAALGYKLEITFDTQDSPRHITYTLIMKNSKTNHWQLKRVSSTLLGDFEKDFNSMVLLMETNLTTHE